MDYMKLLEKCNLCMRNCNVNRNKGVKGLCNSTNNIRIARAALHFWEEPCISGENGSGTVFFSNCNLKCVFCQNYEISSEGFGKEITIDRLADIFIELQEKGANNINLVTPTHFVPQIIEALKIAKNNGLDLPIVYNTNSIDTLDTIKALNGYIDVYLPDFKYFEDKYSMKYSKIKGYSKNVIDVIDEMIKQVGAPKFNKDGIIEKGVIVRHLLLPGLLFDSKKVVDAIYNNFGDNVYISLMNQYTPMHNAKMYPEINKSINEKTYDVLIDYALSIGIKNGFIQESGTNSKEFVPDFNNEGV
ncbi:MULTISPECIES: radical SAM protein [unclassified Clostridium]|uniref:radical SAM protein n=1 Tax=Clostridium TaxID=1485 RepID=UPI001C8CA1C6|nr:MULTISPECIES: radical SAM protein [unclassified Clostridium]MBX9136189.1 radical SAM protein [Clostridium sp. K12(2020)]MBX9143179.1 radical SAM protein [Clostridium sp. K13]MDU2289447.1 radical SAM protein [Clostridium celatum]MDU4326631.1 radical SAM protein [Clostridium celatum]